MKMNNKGFFLAETIIIVALVTTVMAFVYPNVAKLYDNYKNRALYYDQTEDLYNLKAIYEMNSVDIDSACSKLVKDSGIIDTYMEKVNVSNSLGFDLYISSYMASPNPIFPYENNYNFKKYLKRLKKVNYDKESCRLIGVFKSCPTGYYLSSNLCKKGGASNKTPTERYASIKLEKDSIARTKYKVPDLKVDYYVELNGVKSCDSGSSAVTIVPPNETNNKCTITGTDVDENVVITVKTTDDVEVISNIKVTN